MSKRAVYKTFREENGEVHIDLTVLQENKEFEVKERVHNIDIKGLTSDQLNMVLSGLDVPEEVKLEIKKAVLRKQVGLLEDKKHRFDEMLPRIKDSAEYGADNIEEEFQLFEDRIRKELTEMEELLEKFFK